MPCLLCMPKDWGSDAMAWSAATVCRTGGGSSLLDAIVLRDDAVRLGIVPLRDGRSGGLATARCLLVHNDRSILPTYRHLHLRAEHLDIERRAIDAFDLYNSSLFSAHAGRHGICGRLLHWGCRLDLGWIGQAMHQLLSLHWHSARVEKVAIVVNTKSHVEFG